MFCKLQLTALGMQPIQHYCKKEGVAKVGMAESETPFSKINSGSATDMVFVERWSLHTNGLSLT